MAVFEKLLRLPARIRRRLYRELHLRIDEPDALRQAQDKHFRSLGLDRSAALDKLDAICRTELGAPYDENNGMYSEHLVLLSALSLADPGIREILEIGTYDGRSAFLLSRLFPQSHILTIDLPAASSDFSGTYQRKDVAEFLARRDAYLGKNPAIEFREMNSLALIDMDRKFDLIWVDGAHGYPVAAIDIVNACRLMTPRGWVLLDDVFTSVDRSNKWYQSLASYETLTELKAAGLIPDFHLILKRVGVEHNFPWMKKFVGLFRRT